MIRTVAFSPEHLSNMKLKECFTKDGGAVDPNAKFDPRGVLTLMSGDAPVAVLGGYFIAPGVYQVWSLLSEDIKKIPIGFHRAVKLIIETWFGRLKLQRMQMTVQVGHTEGWKWAQALGFKSEGIMRCYGPNRSDYWLFGRVEP